jgi:hypothetical protein
MELYAMCDIEYYIDRFRKTIDAESKIYGFSDTLMYSVGIAASDALNTNHCGHPTNNVFAATMDGCLGSYEPSKVYKTMWYSHREASVIMQTYICGDCQSTLNSMYTGGTITEDLYYKASYIAHLIKIKKINIDG